MIIAQIVLDGASQYERKSQKIDAAALSDTHTVVSNPADAEIAHVYGPLLIPNDFLRKITIPYGAAGNPETGRFSLRKPPAPRFVITPLRGSAGYVPEAVDDVFFSLSVNSASPRDQSSAISTPPRDQSSATSATSASPRDQSSATSAPPRDQSSANSASPRDQSSANSASPRDQLPAREKSIGSFDRPSTRNAVEQTVARIDRFRSDVTWKLFTRPPSPDDLLAIDLWADPASDDSDLDGFTAEALVAGLPTVSSRTAINVERTEGGRLGALVPPRDPNEWTHAILTALFKPEVVQSSLDAARRASSKFRADHRRRALEQIYRSALT